MTSHTGVSQGSRGFRFVTVYPDPELKRKIFYKPSALIPAAANISHQQPCLVPQVPSLSKSDDCVVDACSLVEAPVCVCLEDVIISVSSRFCQHQWQTVPYAQYRCTALVILSETNGTVYPTQRQQHYVLQRQTGLALCHVDTNRSEYYWGYSNRSFRTVSVCTVYVLD